MGIYEDTAARQVSPPGTAIVDPSPQVGAAAEKRVVKKAGVRFFGEREKKVDARPLACSATALSHLPAVQQTTSIRAVTRVRETQMHASRALNSSLVGQCAPRRVFFATSTTTTADGESDTPDQHLVGHGVHRSRAQRMCPCLRSMVEAAHRQ